MASAVTVLGSNNTDIKLNFDSQSNYNLALQIAARINASVTGGAAYKTSFDDVPPPPLPHGDKGGYYQTMTNFVVMPKDYVVDLINTLGPAFIEASGQANQMIMSDAATNLTFFAPHGSGTVVGGGGTSRFILGPGSSGDWELVSGAGNDTVQALGRGNDTINAGDGHNVIVLGSGDDLITSLGYDTISAGSGRETINAMGAKGDLISGNDSNLFFVGGSGGATIFGGTGSDTYIGAQGITGNQVVWGGTAGHNQLFAGDGPTTLFGGGNKDYLAAMGGSGQLLAAASGNETLDASAAFGADTLVGGSGHTTMLAGFGQNTFEFISGNAGHDSVGGIAPFTNWTIHLAGYGPNEAANAVAGQTHHGGNTTITLSDHTKVTFINVASLDITKFS